MLSKFYDKFIVLLNSIMRYISSGRSMPCHFSSLENPRGIDCYDEYLLKHINKNKISLVDIGAHRGDFVKMIEERIGISNAILVEPIPACFEYLKAEFGGRYTILNNIVIDKLTENALFHIYDFAETSSVLAIKDIKELAGVETGLNLDVNISSLTLDVLYSKYLKGRLIDLAKIDVQGAEHLVLASAGQFLKYTNFVWIEVSFKQLYDNSMLFNDIYNLMAKLGFILIEISPGHRSVEGELLQADVLFKNKTL